MRKETERRRRRNLIGGLGFCALRDVYKECPQHSAPVTIGTIVDETPWLRVIPCPGTCSPAPYIEGPLADELRPYAGTVTTRSFFGSVSCRGVEGCAMAVDHWGFSSCVTSTEISSWGWLKTIYR